MSRPSRDRDGEGCEWLREGEGREEDLRDVDGGGRLREVAGGDSSGDGVSSPLTNNTSIPLPFNCAV